MSSPAACFIVGTDTDVGKTMVTAGLLLALAASGQRIQALKPVQTGDILDEAIYAQVCPGAQVRTLRHFHLAASPHLAADREGRRLDLDNLAEEITRETTQADFSLIEGSGGVCTPLNQTETFLDLMTRLPFPVLLVIRNALGAINHSLLSLAALRGAALKVAGLVINQSAPPAGDRQMLLDDNLTSIPAMSQAPLLCALPYLNQPNQAPDSATARVELAKLLKPAAEHLLNQIKEF